MYIQVLICKFQLIPILQIDRLAGKDKRLLLKPADPCQPTNFRQNKIEFKLIIIMFKKTSPLMVLQLGCINQSCLVLCYYVCYQSWTFLMLYLIIEPYINNYYYTCTILLWVVYTDWLFTH